MVVMEKETEHPAPPYEPQKLAAPEPRQKAMITINDVDFCYGANQVLYDVNLEIPPRAVTAFIGPSGCGKTTLLRCFNRMNDLIDGAHISAGSIELEGRNINEPDVDVVELRRRVGMVFQKSNPFPKSIYENVAYGLRVLGATKKSQVNEAVEKSLRAAALWDEVKDRLDSSAYGLSGGQQQRRGVALIAPPSFILVVLLNSARPRKFSAIHRSDKPRIISPDDLANRYAERKQTHTWNLRPRTRKFAQ